MSVWYSVTPSESFHEMDVPCRVQASLAYGRPWLCAGVPRHSGAGTVCPDNEQSMGLIRGLHGACRCIERVILRLRESFEALKPKRCLYVKRALPPYS